MNRGRPWSGPQGDPCHAPRAPRETPELRNVVGTLSTVKADLVRGHLDALLLATLDDGPLHGYAIIEALESRSGGVLDIPTGSVYPALRRLERANYVTGSWSVVGGRRRRTYQLTRAGRQALARERSNWQRFTTAIGTVLRGEA